MFSAVGLKYLPFCEKCRFFRGCFYCANTPVYTALLVRTRSSSAELLDDSFPQCVCFLERQPHFKQKLRRLWVNYLFFGQVPLFLCIHFVLPQPLSLLHNIGLTFYERSLYCSALSIKKYIGRCIHKVQKLDQMQGFLLQRFPQRELKWEIKERKSSSSRTEPKYYRFFYEPHMGVGDSK